MLPIFADSGGVHCRWAPANAGPATMPELSCSHVLRWVLSPSVRHGGTIQQLWVRRGVCPHCAASHALLPEFLLAHRLDTLDTISDALSGRPEPHLARSTL